MLNPEPLVRWAKEYDQSISGPIQKLARAILDASLLAKTVEPEQGRPGQRLHAVEVMASERVKEDVRKRVYGAALYARATVLRVIDEEVIAVRAEQHNLVRSRWDNESTWNRLQAQIDALRNLRARFEEADDDT